jgi:hypothetical protein
VYDGTDREVGNGVAAGRQTTCTSVSMRSITDDAGMDIIEVPLFASINVCASEFQIPGFFSQTVSDYRLKLAIADCNCANTKKLKWHIQKLISIQKLLHFIFAGYHSKF